MTKTRTTNKPCLLLLLMALAQAILCNWTGRPCLSSNSFRISLPTSSSSVIDSPDCQAGHSPTRWMTPFASSTLLVAQPHRKRRGEYRVYSPCPRLCLCGERGLAPRQRYAGFANPERARGIVPVCLSSSFCRGNCVYGRVVGRRFCDTVDPLLTHRAYLAYRVKRGPTVEDLAR